MRKLLHPILFLSALVLLSCIGDQGEPAGEANLAYAWHDSVMAAMGGEKAWNRARYLTFRWNVIREGEVVSQRVHHWDRWGGKYRLETEIGGSETMGSDASLVALFDVETGEGQAWLDGRLYSDQMGAALVERAYSMFINDTYWLLMPYKWRDPGVNVEYLGQETDEDGTFHVVHLSFDQVGLTPGDQYWVYIPDELPHLVRKWQYHLQDQEEKGPVIYWRNWQDFGPIKLATLREPGDGGFQIEFTEIEVSRDVPEGVFEPPSDEQVSG